MFAAYKECLCSNVIWNDADPSQPLGTEGGVRRQLVIQYTIQFATLVALVRRTIAIANRTRRHIGTITVTINKSISNLVY